MENRSHAFLAGLFALIFLCAVAATFWWFSGTNEVTKNYVVITEKNLSGLNLQGQVRYRGIRIGTVFGININPKNYQETIVHIRIREDIPITESTIARLGYQGVTGIAHILLEESGESKTALAAEGKIPMRESQLQEITDSGGDALREARQLLMTANQFMANNEGNLKNIVINLDETTKNIAKTSAQLEKLLSRKNAELIQATLTNANLAAAEAAPLFAEARTLVSRLNSASDKFDSLLTRVDQAGAAKMVGRVNELSAELTQTAQQLNRVLIQLEDAPQSLIWGRNKKAGPGETGFVAPNNAIKNAAEVEQKSE